MLVFLDAELPVYRLIQHWTCRACLLLGARAQCVLMDAGSRTEPGGLLSLRRCRNLLSMPALATG